MTLMAIAEIPGVDHRYSLDAGLPSLEMASPLRLIVKGWGVGVCQGVGIHEMWTGVLHNRLLRKTSE